MGFTVVLAENDALAARSLAASLDKHFPSIKIVHSADELKSAIPRLRANAAIVDLETVSLSQVADLRREFELPVVCTHRVPDEELWTKAMEAGAADVCDKSDITTMLRAIRPAPGSARSSAA